jgi:hypothetical protein
MLESYAKALGDLNPRSPMPKDIRVFPNDAETAGLLSECDVDAHSHLPLRVAISGFNGYGCRRLDCRRRELRTGLSRRGAKRQQVEDRRGRQGGDDRHSEPASRRASATGCADRRPRFRTISSISPRVFMSIPSEAASRLPSPVMRAATKLPPNLPIEAVARHSSDYGSEG